MKGDGFLCDQCGAMAVLERPLDSLHRGFEMTPAEWIFLFGGLVGDSEPKGNREFCSWVCVAAHAAKEQNA